MPFGGTYSTGTISLVNGSTAVVGTGTLWSLAIEEGDLLLAEGLLGYIPTVTDDTHIVLEKPWPGATNASASYVINKSSFLRYDPALTQAKLRQMLEGLTTQTILFNVVGAAPDPSLGDEGQFAVKLNTGAWKAWLKTGGVWVLQGIPVGIEPPVAYNSGSTFPVNSSVTYGGALYVSLQAGNLNHQPDISPTWWVKVSAQGDPGRDGGGVTIQYAWSTVTADSDPGNGVIRQSADGLTLRVDLLDANGHDATYVLTSVIGGLAGASAIKGHIHLYAVNDQSNGAIYQVNSVASPSGYRNVSVNPLSGGVSFTDGQAVILAFTPKGDKGDPGTDGDDGLAGDPGGAIAIPYTFSTINTDGDPGNGTLRLNAPTQNTSTIVRADLIDANGATRTTTLDSLAAATSTIKGQMRLYKKSDPTKYLIFNITTGAAPSGYRNISVDFVEGSASSPFANGDAIIMVVTPKGDKGDPGGTGNTGAAGDSASVTAGPTTTGAAGSTASVINVGTIRDAIFDFTIPGGPQGIQGIQGQGIEPDATGTLTDRDTYDNQSKGFVFMETDVSPFALWIKASNSSGDWAGPSYVGGTAAVGDYGSVADSVLNIFDYGSVA